jgi:hypothetical protein
MGVVAAKGAVAQLAEAQGPVQGSGWGVQVVGDQPRPLGGGPFQQPFQQTPAEAPPALFGPDVDRDAGELALQPATGTARPLPDGLAQAAVNGAAPMAAR